MSSALALAVLASVGYGIGAVLQAVGAMRSTVRGRVGIAAFAREPVFALGLLADIASWAISRVALRTMPLFAVQTVLAGSVAITVVLARVVLGVRLRRRDRWAIAASMFGLVIVGISAGKAHAKPTSHLLTVCILLGIPALMLIAAVVARIGKSVILAILAGLSFTGSALAARSAHWGCPESRGCCSAW